MPHYNQDSKNVNTVIEFFLVPFVISQTTNYSLPKTRGSKRNEGCTSLISADFIDSVVIRYCC